MSVNTLGYVITPNKSLKEIASILQDCIGTIKGESDKPRIGNVNSRVECNYRPKDDFFTFNFLDGKDKRILWVFLSCDCDIPKEIGDCGITLSFGCWGNSRELMIKFLKSLNHLGKTYLNECDCDEKPLEEIS